MTFHDHRTPLPAAVPPAARGLPGPTSRARKPRTPRPFTTAADPSTFGEWYALHCVGDCCDPEIPHGSMVMCNSLRAPFGGDFVAIYFTPEAAERVGFEAWIKRLVIGQHPSQPGRAGILHEGLAPVVIVEQLNPRRSYCIPWSDVRALHYCHGVVPDNVRVIESPEGKKRRAVARAAVEVAA